LVLPKFETNFDWTDVEENLKDLGLETLFDSDKAKLTEISDEPLHISKVCHKAVVKVYEEGSEAAAAGGSDIEIR
jgi:serine protease inhibitor